MDKIKEVCIIEGAVFETQQAFEVAGKMMQHKLVRIIIHAPEQFPAFIDYYGTIAPRKNGRKETRNFYILLFGEEMWNANGIIFNKRSRIILDDFGVKKIVERLIFHSTKLRIPEVWG